MPRLITIVGLGVAALLGAQSPGRDPIEIPFTFTTRQPIVEVSVNGAAPIPFIIDTGASINIIDGGVMPRPSAAGSDVLRIAGVDWRQELRPMTMGYPTSRHFAGLIGAPLLSDYVVQFDFGAQVVRLFNPASFRTPAGAYAIPFELQEGLPVVHVAFDAGTGPITARLMVDTGASQFIDFNRPFVDRHNLVAALQDSEKAERPAAVAGVADFLYGTIPRVMFGDRTFERPRVGLSRASTGSSSRAERDGIIGNDLLRHFRVTVDYARKRILLEPNARDHHTTN